MARNVHYLYDCYHLYRSQTKISHNEVKLEIRIGCKNISWIFRAHATVTSMKNGDIDEYGYQCIKKENQPGTSSTEIQSTRKTSKHPEFKIWICDLLNIKISLNNNNDSTYYNFRGFLVNIVDIYGVVTEVCSNKHGFLYKVQDGTGEIGCWHDNRRILKKESLKNKVEMVMENIMEKDAIRSENSSLFSTPDDEDPDGSKSSQSSAVVEVAQWLEKQILHHVESKGDSFNLGDTVQIRGKLADFREERCIRIYNIRLVKDINEEIDRRFELIHLYETLYSREEQL